MQSLRVPRLLLWLIIVSGTVLCAQQANWTRVSGIPGGNISAVHQAPDGKKYLSTTGSFYSFDEGDNRWYRVHSLEGIREIISTDSVVSATSWNSGSVLLYPSGQRGSTGYQTMTVVDQNVIFAGGGFFEGVFRSTDHGVSWLLVAHDSVRWVSLTASPGGALIAVNQHSEWYEMEVDSPFTLRQLDFGAPGTDFRFGAHDDILLWSSDTLSVSTDGGMNWSAWPFDGLIRDAARTRSGTFYVTLYLLDGSSRMTNLLSVNGGMNWTMFDSTTGVHRITEFHDGSIIGIGDGAVFRLDTSTYTWTKWSDGIEDPSIQHVAIAPDGTIYAATYENVWRSGADGSQWMAINGHSLGVATDRWGNLFVQKSESTMQVSPDRGMTWVDRILPTNTPTFRGIVTGSEGNVYIVSPSDVWKTPDAGVTWDSKALPGTFGFTRQLMVTSEGALYLHGDVVGGVRSYFYARDWTGDWVNLETRSNQYFSGSAWKASNRGVVIIVGDNVLHRSTDEGFHWRTFPVPNAMLRRFEGMLFVGRDLLIGYNDLVHGSGLGVFMSQNDGELWINITHDFEEWANIREIHASPDGYLYASTYAKGLFRYKLGDVELPSEGTIVGTFPNPFNPTTRIEFELAQASTVTLAVYDMSGRRIALLANGLLPIGSHVRRWDAGCASTGVYIAILTADGQKSAQKMVLIK